MGVILAATDALNWLARLLDREPAALTKALDGMAAPEGPLFLPYLGGERTPHNDAAIRGVLTGLDHGSGPEALTRAVLDGVAFALADCRDALAATGTRIDSLLAVGGGAKSELWLEIIATALNAPLTLPADGEFGAALGAARLGLMAAEGAGVEAAPPRPLPAQSTPNVGLRAAYAEAHARYKETYKALKDI